MIEPEPLQQFDRTYVRYRGRKLSYFSGCDYFRLSSHPKVLAALGDGARRYGLNVAASRLTSGNHRLYGQLEQEIVGFFGAPAALLVPSGYMSNLVVTQSLAGNFSHALVDEGAHASLQDAARFLDCPVLPFKHQNAQDLFDRARRCGPGARLIVLTDGLFAYDGSVPPLAAYIKGLPSDALLLVDDAHGAGVVGRSGKGSLEHTGISRRRVIQTITLSKAFGTYGGAILCGTKLRQRVLDRSAMFAGSTPVPLALAQAAIVALGLLRKGNTFRQRLVKNSAYVKRGLRAAGLSVPERAGPILRLSPPNTNAAQALSRKLLRAEIFPAYICYPSAAGRPYFRFVISSEHTQKQLDALVDTLANARLAAWEGMG